MEYLDNCERIADYVNVVFLDGNEVVCAEDIQEMDSVMRRIRKKWGNLHSMLDMSGKLSYLKKWVPDYTINILEVRRYPGWERFKSDLRQVFGYLQNATDGQSIQKYIKEHKKEYEDLEEDAFDIISTVTNATELMRMKEKSRNKEGRIDMCKALQEWAEMERMAGRSEGRSVGRTEESIGIVRRKLNQGLSQEAISHWMELDISFVARIAELNKEFPNDSDERITEIYLSECRNV